MKSSESIIHFETRRDNKTRWIRQAQLEGQGLTDWITDTLEQRVYDYNIRGMKDRIDRPRSAVRGKAVEWLRIASMVTSQKVNSTKLCQALDISRSSLVRHLADMERVYGFIVEYTRPDGRNPGWYIVTDWGLLNEQAVVEKYT